MALFKRLIAEWVGTFWLVFGGIVSAVFATSLEALTQLLFFWVAPIAGL